MRWYRRPALAVAVVALASCSVSQDQEVAIGRQNAEEINAKLPIIRDSAVADYVQQLGTAIARTTSRSDLNWQFFIVDSKEVNAFALPGGFVYVNRGLRGARSRPGAVAYLSPAVTDCKVSVSENFENFVLTCTG